MAVQFQTVDVKFTQGLDNKTSKKLVVPGKWDTLINVTLSKDYALKRRDGYEVLISGQAGNGLVTRDAELLVVNGDAVSTVDSTTPAVAKQVPGRLPFVDIAKSEVISNESNHDALDMAYGNGFTCYVWRERNSANVATGINCTVIDDASGGELVSNRVILASATASSPRVVFVAGAFFIFVMDTPNLQCAVIATSAPSTVGTTASIQLDANLSNKNFDAISINSTDAFVTFVYTDGTTSVRALAVTRAGTVPAISAGPVNVVTEANVTNASIQALTCAEYAAGGLVGVFLIHTAGGALGGGLVGTVINSATLAVTTASALIDATVPPVASATHCTATAIGSNMQVFTDQQSSYLSANLRPLRSVLVSSVLAAVLPAGTALRSATFRINAAEASGPQGPFISGKAFTSGSRTFLPLMMLENYFRPLAPLGVNTDNLSTQCSFYVADMTDWSTSAGTGIVRIVAGALYRVLGLIDTTLGGAAPTVSTPCSTPALASGFGIALMERGRLSLVSGVNITPVGISRVTMTPRTSSPGLDVELGESAYLTGGQLGNYDGVQITQHGFPNFPEGISAVRVATGGAGGKLTVGVHQLVAVYEITDGAGNRHQSAPSLPVSVTVQLDSDTIAALCPTTQLPQSAGYDTALSTLNIVFYMTAAGGLTFYRTVSDFATPLTNNVAASTVGASIGTPQVMPDARLTQNELLYTQPNQAGTTLPNIAPGPVHGIGVSQKRVWYFKSDQQRYGFSQEVLPNTGLQFNDALGGSIPAGVGNGVATFALDEKTILFCERKLFVVYGRGPSPSGGFNNFSEPEPIASDVGCTDARSVLETPMGLIFKSAKGFQLLRRDLSVEYIGDGVAAYDAFDVTAAVLLGDEQEARFTLGGTEGQTLVYSYGNLNGPQWSVFHLDSPGALMDAVWWPTSERYVHLHKSTALFPGLMQDTPGAYIDGVGAASPLLAFILARTSFLKVGALEGFQRVRWLYVTATADAAPTTNFAISVDFDDVYAALTVGAYTATTDLGTIAFPSVQAVDLRHRLARQKCKSVAFTFLDAPTAGDPTKVPLTGLQAMALEIGLKKGVNRLPAAQSV